MIPVKKRLLDDTTLSSVQLFPPKTASSEGLLLRGKRKSRADDQLTEESVIILARVALFIIQIRELNVDKLSIGLRK